MTDDIEREFFATPEVRPDDTHTRSAWQQLRDAKAEIHRLRKAVRAAPERAVAWQWRSRIKGGAWDAWEQGRFGGEVPPFMELEERQVTAAPVSALVPSTGAVGALEWARFDSGGTWAKTDIGLAYFAEPDGSWRRRNGEPVKAGNNLSAAQAGAQADFEARVRSVLVSDPDGSEVVAALLAGKPFVFDPATNFIHADDGGAPLHGEKWAPASDLEQVTAIALGHFTTTTQRAQATADDIRAQGWAVAVHNDYRLNGKAHTFWLFTKDGRAIKGEGQTDAEALNQVRAMAAVAPSALVPDPAAREVVAWQYRKVHWHDGKPGPWSFTDDPDLWSRNGYEARPLYAAPAREALARSGETDGDER